MGLIKKFVDKVKNADGGALGALNGSVSGALADQWLEFFYCESLPPEILLVKGSKKVSGRSVNTKASDNVISNGSTIAVADGQCMIIVEQGAVVDFCAEPGEYTYKTDIEPSLLSGSLNKESILATFKEVGKRFTYGGEPAKDQRVYYVNTKEITENKFGTPNPIPFRVVDTNIGLDLDSSVRMNGIYSYKIIDPLRFYKVISGNVSSEYRRSSIETQLKSEFLNALQPAMAQISALGIRPSALPGHTTEIATAMNNVLSSSWGALRGIEVVAVAVASATLPQEDQDMIKELQKTAVNRNVSMAAATQVTAQADAMRAAAQNEAGAMTGFMGLGFAQNAGGNNVSSLFSMAQQQQTNAPAAPATPDAPAANSWTCACGAVATGKFCPECGSPKPAEVVGWTCPTCGAINKGKFCQECGTKKPAAAPLYRCDKCGWEPEDPKNPPKFCPECGDRFDENDIKA